LGFLVQALRVSIGGACERPKVRNRRVTGVCGG
jgi:hypothetical protein